MERLKGASLPKAMASLINVRLGWKVLLRIATLVYSKNLKNTVVKGVVTLSQLGPTLYNFFDFIYPNLHQKRFVKFGPRAKLIKLFS